MTPAGLATSSRPARAGAGRPRLPLLWVTWRQHGPALCGAAGLVAVAAAGLLIARWKLQSVIALIGAPDWPQAADSYGVHYPDIAMQAIPLFAALLVGIPLAAGDLAGGTTGFAWTQGTTRMRWLLGKLAIVAVPLSLAAAVLGLVFGWFFGLYVPAVGHWGMSAFALYAPASAGWMLAGLTLGMAAGAIVRDGPRARLVTAAGTAGPREWEP